MRSAWLAEPSKTLEAGWCVEEVTISTSSGLSDLLVIASAEASSAGGMSSSVMTWAGMCASVSSLLNVEIGSGSWTLRSNISEDAGLCSLGELDRNLEGDADIAEW